MVHIYCDGGCFPNPGPGGWAAKLIWHNFGHSISTKHISGGERSTTNNRMEMTAALKALQQLTRPCRVKIFTDSKYLRNCMTKWMIAWKSREWETVLGEPVKNQDLIMALYEESKKHTVEWIWIKGHAGNLENEEVDAMATAARLALEAL